MKGHNTFYNNQQKIVHKIVAAIYVDYLPGDILAYTDRKGWINIFVKEEFYARTKSETEAAKIIKQLKHWMITDFYDLKTPEGKKEWDEAQAKIAKDYQGLVWLVDDFKRQLEDAEDLIAQLKHDHPHHKGLQRKEN